MRWFSELQKKNQSKHKTKQMRNTICVTKHRLQCDILISTAHNSHLIMCWCWTQNTLRIKYFANFAVIENAMECLTNERFTRISELKSNKIVALVNSKFFTKQSIWFSCNLLARKSTQIVIDSFFLLVARKPKDDCFQFRFFFCF